MTVRIATRRSALAMWQAHHVSGLLTAREPGLEVQLLELMTRGDRILDVPLAEVGGKGLFVKEIEDALLRREAQIAVHSMKDLPAVEPPGLVIAAVPVREDPRDALVLPRQEALRAAPRGPGRDRQPAPLGPAPGHPPGPQDRDHPRQRGHAPAQGSTRASTRWCWPTPGCAASASPTRSPRSSRPEEMLPAVAQGALAIEAREDDAETLRRLAPLEDRDHPDPDRGGARVPPQAAGWLPGAHRGPRRGEGRPGPPARPGRQPGRHGDHPRRAAPAWRRTRRGLGEELANELLARGAGEILGEPSRRGRGSLPPSGERGLRKARRPPRGGDPRRRAARTRSPCGCASSGPTCWRSRPSPSRPPSPGTPSTPPCATWSSTTGSPSRAPPRWTPPSRRIVALGMPPPPVGTRLAAVGKATAHRLQERLRAPDLVPESATGAAMAEAMAPLVRGRRVLVPRAAEGRPRADGRARRGGRRGGGRSLLPHRGRARGRPRPPRGCHPRRQD